MQPRLVPLAAIAVLTGVAGWVMWKDRAAARVATVPPAPAKMTEVALPAKRTLSLAFASKGELKPSPTVIALEATQADERLNAGVAELQLLAEGSGLALSVDEW